MTSTKAGHRGNTHALRRPAKGIGPWCAVESSGGGITVISGKPASGYRAASPDRLGALIQVQRYGDAEAPSCRTRPGAAMYQKRTKGL